MAKKFTGDKIKSKELWKNSLQRGLETVNMHKKGELTNNEMLIQMYAALRPLAEADKKKAYRTIKAFTDDEDVIKMFWQDISEAVYNRRRKPSRTIMKSKSATFLLIALARGVLGKETVKSIVEEYGISFQRYGNSESLKNFIDDCKQKGTPMIKLPK